MTDSKITVYPLPGYVLLSPYKQDWGGLAMPQKHGEHDAMGVVEAIGEPTVNEWGTEVKPTKGISVGDVVIHSKMRELEYNDFKGKKLKFVPFNDLVGKVGK